MIGSLFVPSMCFSCTNCNKTSCLIFSTTLKRIKLFEVCMTTSFLSLLLSLLLSPSPLSLHQPTSLSFPLSPLFPLSFSRLHVTDFFFSAPKANEFFFNYAPYVKSKPLIYFWLLLFLIFGVIIFLPIGLTFDGKISEISDSCMGDTFVAVAATAVLVNVLIMGVFVVLIRYGKFLLFFCSPRFCTCY